MSSDALCAAPLARRPEATLAQPRALRLAVGEAAALERLCALPEALALDDRAGAEDRVRPYLGERLVIRRARGWFTVARLSYGELLLRTYRGRALLVGRFTPGSGDGCELAIEVRGLTQIHPVAAACLGTATLAGSTLLAQLVLQTGARLGYHLQVVQLVAVATLLAGLAFVVSRVLPPQLDRNRLRREAQELHAALGRALGPVLALPEEEPYRRG